MKFELKIWLKDFKNWFLLKQTLKIIYHMGISKSMEKEY